LASYIGFGEVAVMNITPRLQNVGMRWRAG
jgi:hypothetical protein